MADRYDYGLSTSIFVVIVKNTITSEPEKSRIINQIFVKNCYDKTTAFFDDTKQIYLITSLSSACLCVYVCVMVHSIMLNGICTSLEHKSSHLTINLLLTGRPRLGSTSFIL